MIWMAASFLLVGFGVKSALFPLHVWLPDAHSMLRHRLVLSYRGWR